MRKTKNKGGYRRPVHLERLKPPPGIAAGNPSLSADESLAPLSAAIFYFHQWELIFFQQVD